MMNLARGQSVQINVKDMSAAGLHLIPSTDPAFEGAFSGLLGSAATSPIIAIEKPFSVIFQNNSSSLVCAYAVRYQLVDASGKQLNSDWLWIAIGESGRTSLAVPPGGDVFITPLRALAGEPAATGGGNTALDEQAFKRSTAMANRMSKQNSITISLDAVIFEDGTFVGANDTRAWEQINAYLYAKRGVLSEVAARHASGESDASILQWLSGLTSPNPTATSSESVDWNYAERRHTAVNLTRMYQRQGAAFMYTFISRQLSQLPALQLKRQVPA